MIEQKIKRIDVFVPAAVLKERPEPVVEKQEKPSVSQQDELKAKAEAREKEEAIEIEKTIEKLNRLKSLDESDELDELDDPVTQELEDELVDEQEEGLEATELRHDLYIYGDGVYQKLGAHQFIGCEPKLAQIVLPQKGTFVSRRHAEILMIGDRYYIEDCESRNGTYVNDIRLSSGQRMRLFSGDKLQFGKFQTILDEK